MATVPVYVAGMKREVDLDLVVKYSIPVVCEVEEKEIPAIFAYRVDDSTRGKIVVCAECADGYDSTLGPVIPD